MHDDVKAARRPTCHSYGHENVDVHGQVAQRRQSLQCNARQPHRNSAEREPFRLVQPLVPCRGNGASFAADWTVGGLLL